VQALSFEEIRAVKLNISGKRFFYLYLFNGNQLFINTEQKH